MIRTPADHKLPRGREYWAPVDDIERLFDELPTEISPRLSLIHI